MVIETEIVKKLLTKNLLNIFLTPSSFHLIPSYSSKMVKIIFVSFSMIFLLMECARGRFLFESAHLLIFNMRSSYRYFHLTEKKLFIK